MIIIPIGRDENNRIVLDDAAQLISNYHAELKIKDNGSMFLFDKSTNGTFVNSTQIPKTQDFPVYRGNVVSFANKATLNWSMIPEVPATEDTLRIMSIGKNQDNDIQLSTQDRISRHHALLRITKDNSFFVYDLSTNGVFVNNLRIPARSWYKVKYGDNVTFGGTDKLDWAQVPAGGAKKTGKKISMRYLVAAAAAVILVVAGSFLFMQMRQKDVYERYGNTVCMVVNRFVYTIDFGELGTFDITMDEKGNPMAYDPSQNAALIISGTGFFISKDGKLITNRHVASPWSIVKEEDPETYNTLTTVANNFAATVIKKLQDANAVATTVEQVLANNKAIRAWANAPLNIKGHSVEVAIVLNNTYYNNTKDLIDCQVLKVADDERVDIGLLQTNSKTLPAQVKNLVDVNDLVPDQELKPGKKIFVLGFPMGIRLAKTSLGIKANYQNGQVSRETDGFAFGHNVAEEPGASGSPVFDESGRFAGVHYSGIRATQGFKFAIAASQVKKFLN